MEDEAPDVLTEAQLEEELGLEPLSESAGGGPADLMEGNPQTRLVVPKKGPIFDADGVCEVVIIRPCVSRGKRIKGLPPIYTPKMLEANAGVYTGWLMYMDHLTERIVEAMVQEGRSIRELGGRVLKSWWDPTVRFSDDAKFGFQPGGVAARVLPQPPVRKMLEADPAILNVSHNAWPKGARRGKAPWDANLEGYLIEGIRPTPEGSVDWVPRGGAGGRLRLQEWEQFAVSVLGSHYGSASREEQGDMDLANTTREQLVESLKKDNPKLLEALGGLSDITPVTGPASAPVGLTAEDLQEALREQADTFSQQLAEARTTVEERARELAAGITEERAEQAALAEQAKGLIRSAGLSKRWTEDLTRRYALLPSGPAAGLAAVIEAEEPDTALAESIETDVKHARALIEEVGGIPTVSGLGGAASAQQSAAKKKRGSGAFREFLAEGEQDAEKRKKVLEGEGLKEMVIEGVRD